MLLQALLEAGCQLRSFSTAGITWLLRVAAGALISKMVCSGGALTFTHWPLPPQFPPPLGGLSLVFLQFLPLIPGFSQGMEAQRRLK